MITIGGKEITAAYVGKRALSAVYAGARLVWSAISSWFGLGYWKGDEPWNGSDAWNGSSKTEKGMIIIKGQYYGKKENKRKHQRD